METKPQIMYAHNIKGIFFHFYGHIQLVKFCGEYPIFKVEISEDQTGQSRYWGVWNKDKQSFSMIWPSLQQVRICSPDGFDNFEKRGEGKVVCLDIKVIEEMKG